MENTNVIGKILFSNDISFVVRGSVRFLRYVESNGEKGYYFLPIEIFLQTVLQVFRCFILKLNAIELNLV